MSSSVGWDVATTVNAPTLLSIGVGVFLKGSDGGRHFQFRCFTAGVPRDRAVKDRLSLMQCALFPDALNLFPILFSVPAPSDDSPRGRSSPCGRCSRFSSGRVGAAAAAPAASCCRRKWMPSCLRCSCATCTSRAASPLEWGGSARAWPRRWDTLCSVWRCLALRPPRWR